MDYRLREQRAQVKHRPALAAGEVVSLPTVPTLERENEVLRDTIGHLRARLAEYAEAVPIGETTDTPGGW